MVFLLKRYFKDKVFIFSVMFAAFVFAIMLSKDVPKRFFPDSDRPQILVYTQLPAGTSQREMTGK